MNRNIIKRNALIVSLVLGLALPLLAQDFPLEFSQIQDGVWLHRSYALYNGYRTPSNGLLVASTNGLVLVDTAWTPGETAQILAFAKNKLGKDISQCIITHSHADRAGGLDQVLAAGIPVLLNERTRALLKIPATDSRISNASNGLVRIDGLDCDIEFFGPAHAPDNITVWFPARRILFGGCLVKSLDSRDLGNTADADLRTWPIVLQAVIQRYGDARIVIPGHGQPGDAALLRHTLALCTGKP